MIVFNQPIVNKCDPLFLIEVRMCISVCFVSVSRPSRVSQTYIVLMARRSLKLHAFDAVTSESVRRRKFSCDELIRRRVYSDESAGIITS
jgi:hypothetical protein